MNKTLKLLIALISVILIVYINNSTAKENIDGKKLVTKVIDGDTIIIENGMTVRLLGIDTDEKQHECYKNAKNRLEELLLNNVIELKKDNENKDKYGRYLRYVFLNEENINLKIVKEGLAIARVNENGKYKDEIIKAEEYARNNMVGCKWRGFSDDIINACDAVGYLGQEIKIKGKITSSIKSKNGVLFFNLEKNYPQQCLTIVVFKNDFNKFEHLQKAKGKEIVIMGEIKDYNGNLEIILKNEEQIIKLE